jgi:hypothetical protein
LSPPGLERCSSNLLECPTPNNSALRFFRIDAEITSIFATSDH